LLCLLTSLLGLWDLCSLTRDQTCALTRDQTCAPFSEAWILTTGPLETPWISGSDSISDTAAQASATSTPHMNRNSSCSPRHTSPAVPDIHVSAQNCPPWPPSPHPRKLLPLPPSSATQVLGKLISFLLPICCQTVMLTGQTLKILPLFQRIH